MPRPVEIEFLSDGAEPHPDDDVLQLGRPRRFPRWAWIVAIAALAGLIATAIVSRPSSPGRPTATDVPSGPILPPPLRLPSFEAFDAAVSGGRTWVLRDGRITVTDEHGTRRAVSFGIDMSDGNSEARLLVDPPGGLLWVVVEDVRGGQVIEFDATRLTELRSMRLPSIAAAAPLDGRLYVISEGRLVEISRTATPRVRAGLARGRFFALAADPTRNRLLVTDAGAPTHVWSYRPDGTVDAVSQPLALGKGSLAVAAGRVWVGGYSSNGAVLERIVPGRTRRSPLAAQLGPGAWVVAAGERVVWVRSGSGGDDLWCVDAATGRASSTGTSPDMWHRRRAGRWWHRDPAPSNCPCPAAPDDRSGGRPVPGGEPAESRPWSKGDRRESGRSAGRAPGRHRHARPDEYGAPIPAGGVHDRSGPGRHP